MTAIIILSVVLVGLFILSITFRTVIASLLRGAGLYVAGAWNIAWSVIGNVFITALIIGGIGWILLIALMIGLGVYANSTGSAVIIGILFPIWFLLMLIPRGYPRSRIFGRLWVIPLFGIARPILGLVIFFASVFLLFGLWSPTVKSSWNRWSENTKQGIANRLDKDSLQSEFEAGIFAKVDQQEYAIPDKGAPFLIQSDEIIKITDLNGQKADHRSEGKVKVMVKNKYGHYDGGKEGWIPSRVLNWNWRSQPSATNQPATTTEHLVAEVDRRRDPRYAECLTSGGECIPFLSPGDYHLDPSARPGEIKFLLIEEKGLQNLGDGRNFTVPQGKRLFGIMSDQPRKISSGKG